MSTAATFIPTFVAAILVLGGANEFSIQLMLVGVLSIITHTALSPVDPSGLYPNFDNYHPVQPPFRDYVLVFGLASLMFVALFSRIYPLLRTLARATWRNLAPRATTTDGSPSQVRFQVQFQPRHNAPHSCPSPSSTSPSHTSHTFTSQWTPTASTLVDGSPASAAQTISDREDTGTSEIVTLKARVSQLEATLEKVMCRLEVLTTGQKDSDVASSNTATSVTESSPSYTPPSTSNSNAPVLSPSPSPHSPADPNPTPKSVDTLERIRTLAGQLMEGTLQTDQLFLKVRAILAKAADDYEDDSPSGSSASRSTESFLAKHLPPSSSATSITPTPYPSPSPSPSPRPEALRAPTVRRVRYPLPKPSAIYRTGGTLRTPRTPEFDSTLDFSGISKVPCSTPVRSAEEHTISPTPSSFLDSLEVDHGHQDLLVKPVLKRSEEADTRTRPVSRATSIFSRVMPRNPTLRFARTPLVRHRERPSTAYSAPLSRPRFWSTPDSLRDTKGKGSAVRALEGMTDWLAEYARRKDKSPKVSCPVHGVDCRG